MISSVGPRVRMGISLMPAELGWSRRCSGRREGGEEGLLGGGAAQEEIMAGLQPLGCIQGIIPEL